MVKSVSRRTLLTGALSFAATPLLSLPGTTTASSGGTLDRILKEKYARVGFSNFTPWGYVGPDGDLTGVEPTLVKAFLESLGVTNVNGVLTQFVSIIPGLQAGRFDFVGAGMQIRPSRGKEIAFGDPEWMTTQAFMTQRGNPKGLTNLEEVKRHPDARLGVVAGGAEGEYARIAGLSDDQIVVFPDLPTAASGLSVERVDVLMFTSISVRGLLDRTDDPGLQYVAMSRPALDKDGNPAVGYGAIGFRKADADLLNAWNDWLGGVKKSGRIVELLSPFGFTEDDIAPDDVLVADLCRA